MSTNGVFTIREYVVVVLEETDKRYTMSNGNMVMYLLGIPHRRTYPICERYVLFIGPSVQYMYVTCILHVI